MLTNAYLCHGTATQQYGIFAQNDGYTGHTIVIDNDTTGLLTTGFAPAIGDTNLGSV